MYSKQIGQWMIPAYICTCLIFYYVDGLPTGILNYFGHFRQKITMLLALLIIKLTNPLH